MSDTLLDPISFGFRFEELAADYERMIEEREWENPEGVYSIELGKSDQLAGELVMMAFNKGWLSEIPRLDEWVAWGEGKGPCPEAIPGVVFGFPPRVTTNLGTLVPSASNIFIHLSGGNKVTCVKNENGEERWSDEHGGLLPLPRSYFKDSIEASPSCVRQLQRKNVEATLRRKAFTCRRLAELIRLHAGRVDAESGAGADSKVPNRPSDAAFQAWRLRDLKGLKTQKEIANGMSKQLGRSVRQGQVSRWLKQVDQYRKAGGIFPDMPSLSQRPTPLDPSDIEIGQRQDRLTRRQRSRRSPDAEAQRD